MGSADTIAFGENRAVPRREAVPIRRTLLSTPVLVVPAERGTDECWERCRAIRTKPVRDVLIPCLVRFPSGFLVLDCEGGNVSIKARQKLGKYRIEKRLSEGGFATVYQAMDTIEGVRVALKIPRDTKLTDDSLKVFRHEVRLAARLEHVNILPLKDASVIGDHFVITFPLGERTLADRLTKRMSLKAALSFTEQMLGGLAYAHQQRIIHCDVKPENMVLFSGDRLRLGDFGIAKFAQKTIEGSGTGTMGYMAPEQAMGKPSQRSDVFSTGLIIYRMLSGEWPAWPYSWPPPGIARLRARVHPDFITFLRKAIEPDPRHRFRDAEQMRNAFLRLRPRVIQHAERRRIRSA